MGLNPFSLSFRGELEKVYLDAFFKASLNQVRFYLTLAIIFFALFGILDAALLPSMRESLWMIRYGFICPCIIIGTIFTFSRHFKKHMQISLAAMMVCTSLGIIMMIVIAEPPVSYSYYAGLVIELLYGYTLIRLRFLWATVAGWTVVALYEIAAIWLSNTPISVLINNNFFFISANFIGMFGCYSLDYYSRRAFFLVRLLADEQKKVKTANLELEQRVRQRTSQLVKVNEDLIQEMLERKRMEKELIHAHKIEAMGTLAGGIAHDFNNILAAVISYAEIGLHKHLTNPDKTKYSFQQILKASSRAKDLIKQILTFSRQQEQERVPVKTSIIVKEALKLLRATLPKNITISEQIRTDADIVLADPTHIHQIMINLCTNAAHAMRDKGGILEVALEDVYIDSPNDIKLSDLPAGPYLRMSVSDTGTGMDPDLMERIFDPYFTTKRAGEGTGMGLSVVHGIVKSHGGAIAVDGEPGSGSIFHVYLPRSKDLALPSAEDHGPAATGTERILFIDDEQLLTDIVQEMIEEFGYTVITTTSPEEALQIFRAAPERFDLVITDKSMPQMSGFELAHEILQIRPHIPIILMTGFSDLADMERAKAQGFRELIIKPVVMRDMADAIRRVLDQRGIMQ